MIRLVLLCVALSGCAHTEVTALMGPRQVNHDDTEFVLTLQIIERFGKRGHGACGYVHNSEVLHGVPFNDHDELTTDTLGCGVRFGHDTQ